MTIEAYPLTWPPGRPRASGHQKAPFKVTLGRSIQDVQYEVRQLGGTDLIISTNMPLRKDGLPYTKYSIYDPGAAVYFTYKKRQVCFACDRWNTLEANMRAIVKTIEALRGIERWGTGDMVVVIHLDGAIYADPVLPGAVGTVEPYCSCRLGKVIHLVTQQVFCRVAFPGTSMCVNERLLRKIDGEGRKLARWEHCVWQPERLREAA